jgi:hypothetical protein
MWRDSRKLDFSYFMLSHLIQEMELMGAYKTDHNEINCEQDVFFLFYFNLLFCINN